MSVYKYTNSELLRYIQSHTYNSVVRCPAADQSTTIWSHCRRPPSPSWWTCHITDIVANHSSIIISISSSTSVTRAELRLLIVWLADDTQC